MVVAGERIVTNDSAVHFSASRRCLVVKPALTPKPASGACRDDVLITPRLPRQILGFVSQRCKSLRNEKQYSTLSRRGRGGAICEVSRGAPRPAPRAPSAPRSVSQSRAAVSLSARPCTGAVKTYPRCKLCTPRLRFWIGWEASFITGPGAGGWPGAGEHGDTIRFTALTCWPRVRVRVVRVRVRVAISSHEDSNEPPSLLPPHPHAVDKS